MGRRSELARRAMIIIAADLGVSLRGSESGLAAVLSYGRGLNWSEKENLLKRAREAALYD